jgi:uncharacterized Zn finger protein
MTKRRSGYYRSSYDDYDDDYDDDEDDYEEHVTPPDATIIEGPIHANTKRGPMGSQWWGKQWLAAVEQFYDEGRLTRGKTYARNGSVLRLEISYGMAHAQVQGSRRRPYITEIQLRQFSDANWKKALAALSEQAIYAAKLLAGEMPADIETIFQNAGLSLFPQDRRDVNISCTCPDEWSDACKHGAAVYYLLADQFDADPFVLFHLRGRTRDQILAALRGLRGASSPNQAVQVTDSPALDADLATFWGQKTNLIRSAPVQPKEPPFFAKLGEPPGNVGAEFRMIYRKVSEEAYRWLGTNAEDEDGA